MYFFSPSRRAAINDYRNAVHDNDGLAIYTGAEARLWRPLCNPQTLQFSAFIDDNPKGFGLLQRARAFDNFQDAEARYDKRPSAWVTRAATGAKAASRSSRSLLPTNLTTTSFPSGVRPSRSRRDNGTTSPTTSPGRRAAPNSPAAPASAAHAAGRR